VDAQIKNFAMKEFEAIRRNPSEMRSTNIAKVFDQGEDALNEFANAVHYYINTIVRITQEKPQVEKP